MNPSCQPTGTHGLRARRFLHRGQCPWAVEETSDEPGVLLSCTCAACPTCLRSALALGFGARFQSHVTCSETHADLFEESIRRGPTGKNPDKIIGNFLLDAAVEKH